MQTSALNQQISSLKSQLSLLQISNSNLNQRINSLQTGPSTTTSTLTTSITQTKFVYPPSNSTYALTYISGNSTIHEISCGTYNLYISITYEMHSNVSNIILWTRLQSGNLVQPTSQNAFTNQAYLTLDTTYTYSTGACEVGSLAGQNITTYVANSNNIVLSPLTTFIVLAS